MRALCLCIALATLTGCQSTVFTATPEPQTQPVPAVLAPPANSYQSSYTHKALADYAGQLAMTLMRNLGRFDAHDTLAVASFVELDTSLTTTSILGNKMAEKLIAEMQTYGMTLVDFKATGFIEVTSSGDLTFSRRFEDLAAQKNIDYVLTGTLSRHARGVDVSARILSLKNRAVVATANNFIPGFVVADAQPRLSSGH